MGYSERHCQICGVSFNIARIRKQGEPPEDAWSEIIQGYITQSDSSEPCCEAEGCSDIVRDGGIVIANPYQSRARTNVESEAELEHIAGPDCVSTMGYSGWRIGAAEMRDRISVQCLSPKGSDWCEEPTDEDFEKQARYCFVTGVSTSGADEFEVGNLKPVRHGVESAFINNVAEDDPEMAIPMHPNCFEMFKRMSSVKFGKVDIDGFWKLREKQGEYENRFTDFPQTADLRIVMDQWHVMRSFKSYPETNIDRYYCKPGTEYLAADPLKVPGLKELVDSCTVSGSATPDTVFEALLVETHASDPFAILSPELRSMLLELLSRSDVASLRLASRSFRQLPQTFFHHLVRSEMPWMLWEIDQISAKQIDWYELWRKLFDADGGTCMDEKERKWLEDVRSKKYKEVETRMQEEKRNYADEADREIWTSAIGKAGQDVEAEIKAAYEAGMWPEWKDKSLKGLRNRRRIYGDIEEILRRIADLALEDR